MKRKLNSEQGFKTPVLLLCLGLLGLLLTAMAACRSSPPPVPSVVGTVKLPSLPNMVAVDPVNGVAYILHKNTDSISILHGTHLSATVQLASTKLRGIYNSIIVQPSTGRAYVFGSLGRPIRVIELDGTLATIQDPSFWFRDAVANPVTGYIYATNLWDREENGKAIGSSVLVITGTQVVARVPVGRLPMSLAVNQVNGLVYVGDNPKKPEDHDRMMVVISGTQVMTTSDIGWKPGIGGGISAIVINSHTGQVFAYMNNQRLFALQNLKPVQEKLLEKPVMQLRFNPNNHRLYAMMYDEVLVLDTKLNVIEHIPLEPKNERSGNRSMAVDPVRGYVYVGSIGDGTLTVIRDTKIITTLQAGWWTTDIGVDARTGMVYAVNNMSRDVTVVGLQKID